MGKKGKNKTKTTLDINKILLFIQRNLFNKNNKPENLPQFLNRGEKKHSGPESSRHKDVREDKTQADEENILTDDVK